jgi:hypothetical protein
MADKPKAEGAGEVRYLFGTGERLTAPVTIKSGGAAKADAYTVAEARDRLLPRATRLLETLDSLPAKACPEDRTVAAFTLHPQYIAKSYFPSALLAKFELEHVGSRSRTIKAEKTTRKNETPAEETTELFVAAKRAAFRAFAASLKDGRSDNFDDLVRFEDLRALTPEERLKNIEPTSGAALLEVVLHAHSDDEAIIRGFFEYLEDLGIAPDFDRRRHVQGLCFLPVFADLSRVLDLATFSFLRAARPMPRLRAFTPASTGTATGDAGPSYSLPGLGPADASVRVAIFDGGLPAGHAFAPWVNHIEPPSLGPASAELNAHGTAVTSAFLFGKLEEGEAARPHARVDHYRVVDEHSFDATGEYYDVLDRIVDVLGTKNYDFVNLSLGPTLPIEDDEVNLWTAKLDELADDGKMLIFAAVGNGGEGDRASGNARIQAPSDGVNLLGIGAADRSGDNWRRAPYSSLGPGRSPGLVKPDILAFGGGDAESFWTVQPNGTGAVGLNGTSFASPLAMRSAVAIRAHLGNTITPLASRALMIHHARNGGYPIEEVGHGRIQTELGELVTCADGEAHIVYQGILDSSKYLRAIIPMPEKLPERGYVELLATFCFATETDPEDPSNYTRSGLEIVFRPNKDEFGKPEDKRTTAKTRSFFKAHRGPEATLRSDAHKWETAVRASSRFRVGSLNDPVFDIHYNAREAGGTPRSQASIPYALVVTVTVKHMPDLYDRIATRYRTQLTPLRPVVAIPIRARGA